jgi:hypothetical protein
VPSNTTESSTFGASSTSSALSPSPTPFIAFTDSTPLLRATPSGTLSVDVEHVRRLGVELAFWVTVSLAFWEFLREREVSLVTYYVWSRLHSLHQLCNPYPIPSFLQPLRLCASWTPPPHSLLCFTLFGVMGP